MEKSSPEDASAESVAVGMEAPRAVQLMRQMTMASARRHPCWWLRPAFCDRPKPLWNPRINLTGDNDSAVIDAACGFVEFV